MKRHASNCLFLLTLLIAGIQARAAVKYWDINGATAGAGGAAPGGAWTSALWSTDPAGTVDTGAFASGDDAVFSAGSDATGTFTVSGNATVGSILLEEGNVTISGTLTLGAGSITISSGTRLSTSSSIRISASAGSVMTINGGTARTTNTGAAGSFVDTDQAIVLGTGGGTVDYTVANTLNIIGSVISGTGPLTKTGVGVLAIATACTYSGATIINNGELRIRTSANRLPTGTDLTVTSPGILNLNSVAGSGVVGQQVASLSGNGTVGLGNSVFVIGGTANTIFSGAISNLANYGASPTTSTSGNGVTKQGTGTITLSGSNGFTGLLTLTAGGINVTPTGILCDSVCDLLVNGGTLSLTNAAQGIENLGGTGGTIILNSGHTLTINPGNANRSSIFGGAVNGPGSIIKIGAAAESLLGANTYTGPTMINVGKLVESTASSGSGSFTVANGATLGARWAGGLTALPMSDLTLDTSSLECDLADLGFPTGKVIADAGTIAVNGPVAVNAKGFNTTGGPVTVLEHAGLRSGGGIFALGTLPPHTGGVLVDDTANSKVILTVTNADTLVWVSDANGVWDTNNAGNQIWKLAVAGTPTEYQENIVQGDTVRFDGTAIGTMAVNVSVAVSPYKITVDDSVSYTFSGAGKISGIASLTKNGGGTLTITTANDYSGGTTFNGGVLALGSDTALGTGKLTINGSTIRSDSATAHSFTIPVDLNSNETFGDAVNSGDLTFATGAWTIVGASRQITVDTINLAVNSAIGQDVAGRALTKNGNGTLSLGTANTFSGGVTLNEGTLRVNNNNSVLASSPVTLADGVTVSTTAGTARTLTGIYTVNGNFTIGQAVGGTAALTMAGSMNLGGVTRTVTIPNATDTISAVITNGGIIKEGTGILLISSAANTYSGPTTINAGQISINGTSVLGNGAGNLNLAGGKLTSTASRTASTAPVANPINLTTDAEITTTSAAATVDLNFSSAPSGSAGTLTFRNDGADGAADTFEPRFSADGFNFSRPIVLDNGSTGKTRLSFFNTNTTVQTFSGVISGSGSIRRSASTSGTGGTTIFTEANLYSGGTTINDGTLLVNNTSGSGTGPGAVTVNSPGTLGGTGSVDGAVTVNTGGSISAGASAGTLTLVNGLDLSAGGTNVWELAANSTNNPGTSFDQISLTGGNLVLGGSSRVQVRFIGSATFPNTNNAFWLQTNTWQIIVGSGGAANPGPTTFAAVDGANGNNAGSFSTSADASGNVFLTFTPGVFLLPPPPVINPNIVGAGTGSAQVSWSSQAGASYTVQYKTNLNQVGWLNLTNLTATGTTTTIADNTSPVPNERYYRVISP